MNSASASEVKAPSEKTADEQQVQRGGHGADAGQQREFAQHLRGCAPGTAPAAAARRGTAYQAIGAAARDAHAGGRGSAGGQRHRSSDEQQAGQRDARRSAAAPAHSGWGSTPVGPAVTASAAGAERQAQALGPPPQRRQRAGPGQRQPGDHGGPGGGGDPAARPAGASGAAHSAVTAAAPVAPSSARRTSRSERRARRAAGRGRASSPAR